MEPTAGDCTFLLISVSYRSLRRAVEALCLTSDPDPTFAAIATHAREAVLGRDHKLRVLAELSDSVVDAEEFVGAAKLGSGAKRGQEGGDKEVNSHDY